VRGTILGELGWLLYFVVVLAIAVYAFNIYIVPHHFNPTIANVLAAVVAASIYIATRGYIRRRG
jgi:uncharacterized membrane-anchored protein